MHKRARYKYKLATSHVEIGHIAQVPLLYYVIIVGGHSHSHSHITDTYIKKCMLKQNV